MKSNYGNGYKITPDKQIVPIEAMTGEDIHDFAVCCCLLVNFGKMRVDQLQSLSNWIYFRDARINTQVVETCKKIVKEQLGYIYDICSH